MEREGRGRFRGCVSCSPSEGPCTAVGQGIIYVYMYDIMILPEPPVDVVIPKLEGNYCPAPSVCKVKMNRQRRAKRESRYVR